VKRSRAALVALLAVAGAWLAAPASPAVAAQGQLAYDGCLASSSVQGCFALPLSPLQGAAGVAVSPNGKSVYVASYGSHSISHLFRDPASGRLALDGCLNNDGSQNCGDLLAAPLTGANAVAVSPDGLSVYVVSSSSNGTIAHFFRDDPGGQIYYDGCLANDGSQGCVDLPGVPIHSAHAVAMSPDGRSVYVTRTGAARSHTSSATDPLARSCGAAVGRMTRPRAASICPARH
jgi:sugar lactone lactonase YvrE